MHSLLRPSSSLPCTKCSDAIRRYHAHPAAFRGSDVTAQLRPLERRRTPSKQRRWRARAGGSSPCAAAAAARASARAHAWGFACCAPRARVRAARRPNLEALAARCPLLTQSRLHSHPAQAARVRGGGTPPYSPPRPRPVLCALFWMGPAGRETALFRQSHPGRDRSRLCVASAGV